MAEALASESVSFLDFISLSRKRSGILSCGFGFPPACCGCYSTCMRIERYMYLSSLDSLY